MKRQDDLFKLIQSMTRSEKRYFRMNAAVQQGDKQYLRLFDAILKQEQYHEAGLLKITGNQISKNRFNFLKNYLYNSILTILQQLYGKSGEGELRALMDKVSILYNKGLYAQSKKMLLKARKTADELDNFMAIVQLLDLEHSLLKKKKDQTDFLEKSHLILLEQQNFIEKLRLVHESNYLLSSISFLYNKLGHPRSDKAADKYKQLIEHPLFQILETQDSLPFKARMNLLLSKVIFHMCMYQHEQHFKQAGQLIELYQAHKNRIVQSPEPYLSTLSYYLKSCAFLFDEKAFKAALKAVNTLTDTLPANKISPSLSAKIFYTSYYNELFFYLQNCQIAKGLNLVDAIEEGLELYKDQLNNTEKIYLIYSLALIYFGLGRFDESLSRFNDLLNTFKQEEAPFIYLRIRLMLLINHFELENLRLLDYLVVSTYRYLLKKRNMYQYETAVIRFIRKLTGVREARQIDPLFDQLLTELIEIIKDPFEFAGCAWFVFWLEGKTEGISLPDVFHKKLILKSKDLVG